jgi:hypothetical protein
MHKECLFCSREFLSEYREVRYCSSDCKLAHFTRISNAKAKGRLRSCKYCGTNFVPRPKTSIYCSPKCRTERTKILSGQGHFSGSGLSSGEIGAIGELFVCADLLGKGYEVFRSVSPTCSCDLVIFDGCSLLRVEVRTGCRSMDDRIRYSGSTRADVMAVYVPSEKLVIYCPELHGVYRGAGSAAAKTAENRGSAASKIPR